MPFLSKNLQDNLLWFKRKIDLDGKLIRTSMPSQVIDAFETFLKPIDEH